MGRPKPSEPQRHSRDRSRLRPNKVSRYSDALTDEGHAIFIQGWNFVLCRAQLRFVLTLTLVTDAGAVYLWMILQIVESVSVNVISIWAKLKHIGSSMPEWPTNPDPTYSPTTNTNSTISNVHIFTDQCCHLARGPRHGCPACPSECPPRCK